MRPGAVPPLHGTFAKVQPNVCDDPLPVPPSVAKGAGERRVTVERMADGVYLFGGGPANSYMVEFREPAERIAFQADLFDTHEPPRAAQLPAMRSLLNQVQRMKLDVATLAPVHGAPVPWGSFLAAVQSLGGAK